MAMASSAALAGNGAALGSAFAGAKVAVPAQRTVAAKGGASSVSCSLGHAADSRAFALKSFQGKQAFKVFPPHETFFEHRPLAEGLRWSSRRVGVGATIHLSAASLSFQAVPSPPVSRQADWLVILAIQLRGLISCPVPRSFLGRNGGCGKGYPGVRIPEILLVLGTMRPICSSGLPLWTLPSLLTVRCFVQVIAGLQNFDAENVKSIVAAAQAVRGPFTPFSTVLSDSVMQSWPQWLCRFFLRSIRPSPCASWPLALGASLTWS